jgi:alkanesulfonate monooxygenase SsuD/methylene tetrahydromethanopterin reductase-like flavin-dependent oxidoreductase (luciferase family)
MEFGLFFINEKPPTLSDAEVIENALEQCVRADELGFDSVWLGEHHFAPYGTMADTMVFAGAVAVQTRRILIGTAVIVPTFTHPVRVAEQCAMVDVMSGGRFLVGLGRGYQQREFNGYGVPQNESKVRFREAVKIIDGLLSNETFSYDGRFWSFENLCLAPRPTQQPRPPLYLAASATPESTEWMIENDYLPLTGNPYSLDPFSSGRVGHTILDTQRRLGKPETLDEAWGLLHNVLVADTDEDAARIFKANWDLSNEYLITYAKVVEDGAPLPDDYKAYAGGMWELLKKTTYDDMLVGAGSLVGSPDTVAEKLAALYDMTGMKKQLLWMNRGGAVPQQDLLRSMELFATEVMPRVREIGAIESAVGSAAPA